MCTGYEICVLFLSALVHYLFPYGKRLASQSGDAPRHGSSCAVSIVIATDCKHNWNESTDFSNNSYIKHYEKSTQSFRSCYLWKGDMAEVRVRLRTRQKKTIWLCNE